MVDINMDATRPQPPAQNITRGVDSAECGKCFQERKDKIDGLTDCASFACGILWCVSGYFVTSGNPLFVKAVAMGGMGVGGRNIGWRCRPVIEKCLGERECSHTVNSKTRWIEGDNQFQKNFLSALAVDDNKKQK
ncbi:hypothetical protein [Endozoicomonas sp.]|uniref:hypothetical protein n=1 Tax=Endozoicomonas sp. TaxID=1892382 RepID=UPI00383AD210